MTKLSRRGILGAVAASAVTTPAIAQSLPELKWRMTTSWPKSLDLTYGTCEDMAKYVAEMTDGRFQIQVFAGGEIVPPLAATDATSNGTVEMCHTATYYNFGKDPTWALFCAIPFGLNARMQNAWMDGGGMNVMNEFTRKFNVYSLAGGNTGCQMGGWFRSELKDVASLKGLKFRIGGFAGAVLAKLGVVAQQIAASDIYPALERGTIDAAEWVGPHDDEKLGFYKVAKFYYAPGWWEGGTVLHFLINLDKWNSLPRNYKAILAAAATNSNAQLIARFDAQNPAALKRLLANGAQLRTFSPAIMSACLKAANELYAETSAQNVNFKKVWDDIKAFRNTEYEWWQVAEFNYDNFMIRTGVR
jgi:TRAP-type mannitol/chloroaromatic compound transport system substrate-binding protein